MSLQVLLGFYGLDLAWFLWWIWKQLWISRGVSSSFLFSKYSGEEMRTTVMHRLSNLWFGAAVFGTNFWPQFCIVIFFCFCNWYIILIWRVEMPWIKTLKSIDSTCAEREKLYSSPASPWLLPVKTSAKFISDGEHLAPRHDVWADVQEPAVCSCTEPVLAMGGGQPCFLLISRHKSWCWYWYVVVFFVVWGMADETV